MTDVLSVSRLAFLTQIATRFTVPVLWDKKTKTIVNNESSEIIRIFNSGFNDILPAAKAKVDLYPQDLRADIDELNAWVYDTVNSTCITVDGSCSKLTR